MSNDLQIEENSGAQERKGKNKIEKKELFFALGFRNLEFGTFINELLTCSRDNKQTQIAETKKQTRKSAFSITFG